MASRIIHLAISKLIGEEVGIKNMNRFKIGHLLPDAIIRSNESHAASHFKINICEDRKKIIDFNEFHNKYRENIKQDDLYLGYYLHLIEDAVYRKFMYFDYNFGNIGAENFEILHNDYRLLNSYLISKYNLNDEIEVHDELNNESITEIYPFILEDFIKKMKNDFIPYSNGTTVYFTETMVDEFIKQCVPICLKELQAISENASYANPLDYAWDRA